MQDINTARINMMEYQEREIYFAIYSRGLFSRGFILGIQLSTEYCKCVRKLPTMEMELVEQSYVSRFSLPVRTPVILDRAHSSLITSCLLNSLTTLFANTDTI